MSFSTEPTAKTDPTHSLATNGQPNGYTPHNSSPLPAPTPAGRVAKPKTLPSRRARSWLFPLALVAFLLVLVTIPVGWYYFLRPAPARADVLLHTVKREPLMVSVTEKGTLESADNRDIVCKVRAGSKGFASTINWVIDDGSRVNPGQLLMILDDSALKDQEEEQQIKVDTAMANKVKAENDYEIVAKQNEIDEATKRTAWVLAEIDLEKFTGLDYDPTRAPLAVLGSGVASLAEGGSYRQQLDDLTGKVRLSESNVEQYRERVAWAERMVKLSYLSAAQAQSEKSKLDSELENLRSLQSQRSQHLLYNRKQQLADFTSKRDNAKLTYEQSLLQANANLAKAAAEKQRATSEFIQQDEKLRDIKQQRVECRIKAPDDIEPGSMVVYFKPESSRFSNTTAGMIEQGAQVKEGQKMLRIPNLHRMQVNTKVHEAMVARIRGDVRVPTHSVESVQSVMMLNTNSFWRMVGQRSEYVEEVRDELRNLGVREYKTISEGQKATVRVDALSGHAFEGHVRTVAQVASQADSWISDVKLYQTMVLIDYEVLPDGSRKRLQGEEIKPDMTAEVTITVDTAKEAVLAVPVQAVLGGTEMGGKREVFVKTPTGYDRREVVLGIYNDKVVEIREGLSENDEVVLNPKVLLAPDDKTRTRDAAETKGGDMKGAKGKDGGDGSGKGKGGDSPKGPGGSGVPGGKKKGPPGGAPPGGAGGGPQPGA